ncbi:MAG: lipid-binding protein [Bacteroidetes bacterium]|nr:lipid-binding protein [Bacteroidota bacterium]MBS1632233.1 lipid-binding protein [Bacteroidota bacterium]
MLSLKSSSQYVWKQEKDKDGIKVYIASREGSKFRAVKVECTLKGTYAKLFSILSDVTNQKNWVYNSKSSYLISRVSPAEIVYYTETHLPWPMNNRDAVIRLRFHTDSLPEFLTITGTGEPTYIPEKTGKVRVPHFKANWKVTMPAGNSIRLIYIAEADPGGSIPAWIANMFVDKGPFESFKKLSVLLSK